MQIDVRLAGREEKSVLQRLMEFYLYDFSELDGGDVDSHGYFGYDYLDNYWTQPRHYSLLASIDGRLAGFVLVNDYTCVAGNELAIAEFFVMRKYRRRGVGRHIAHSVFDQLPGCWEVRQIAENKAAQRFWRTVIGEYTGGRFEQIELDNDLWCGPVQSFCTGDRL